MFRFRILVISLLLLVASLSLHAATFDVDSLADAVDSSPGDGACDTGTGVCTLRAAIMESNAQPGSDTITFSVSGTIILTGNLPSITDPVWLDGPGSSLLTIDAATNSCLEGLVVQGSTASGTRIENLAISGGTGHGIAVIDASSTVIQGNAIGAVRGGLVAGSTGILLDGTASAATVGGSGAGEGNVIGGQSYAAIVSSDSGGDQIIGNIVGLMEDGSTAAGNAGYGILIYSSSCTARDNVVSAFPNAAALTVFSAAGGATIAGNLIGTDVSGTVGRGSLHGIVSTASGVTIGGTSPADGNVISSNSIYGVMVNGGAGVVIEGNTIGLDTTGTAPLPNSTGIQLTAPATVGGTGDAGNVISGNYVNVGSTAGAASSIIQGNLIGLNRPGTAAIPGSAVGISANAAMTIGGTGTGEGNVISGNGDGISLNASGVVIEGNLIGTDVTGTAALGNQYGVRVPNLGGGTTISGSTIGGNTAAAGNVISGNGWGIQFEISSAGTVVEGNWIGVALDGTTALPNTSGGVHLLLASSGNVVGGSTPSVGNRIENNGGFGLLIEASSATLIQNNTIRNNGADGVAIVGGTGNAILENSIAGNGDLGIDLENDGVTPNDLQDPDGGSNNRQNFPLITSVTATGVSGVLNSTPARSFEIQIFESPSGDAEGATLLGSTTVTTDGTGNATFSLVASPTPLAAITATATDQTTDDTSEFSAPLLVPATSTFAFASPTYAISEDGVGITLTVTRSGDLSAAATVDYTTADGSAAAGSDYTAASGTIAFGPSQSSATLTVDILDDSIAEPDESFQVTLSNPSSGNAVGSPASSTVTITDDEPLPALSISDATVTEGDDGDTTLTFTVMLSGASAQTVTVDYSTADGTATAGSDYVAASGTLTFAPGDLMQTISVPVSGDDASEQDETLTVSLSNPVNASIDSGVATGTIENDDSSTQPIPTLSPLMMLLFAAALAVSGAVLRR